MLRPRLTRVLARVPLRVAGLLTAVAVLASGCSHLLPMEQASEIPEGLVPVFHQAAENYGLLSAAQLAAQARVESKFDPKAVSRAGAIGMMQFLPSTWAEFGIDGNGDGVADPLDPLDAIPSAARYEAHLAEVVGYLPGDLVSLVLAAYNAGPRAVCDAGGIPDYAETRAYVAQVHEWAETFEDQL
ncbi:MAG: lytic transglycosylase domain-containing protein [Frankia sp.]|nr:lytic transglycosylase domain-containing protein [Frankia sp.]